MSPQELLDLMQGRHAQNLPASAWNNLTNLQAGVANSGAPSVEAYQTMYPSNGAGLPRPLNISSGVGPSSPAQIATLQNRRAPVDTVSPDDYVDSSYVYGQDDATLAKNQIARGGTAALNLMGVNSTPSSTNFDYSKVTPIKNADDLLGNPKFAQLARIDPKKADNLYTSFTGRSFATDLKEKEAQKLAMRKDYENGIRDGFIKGDLRRNPTMGWLERRRVVSNPLDPTSPQQVNWEPVSAEMQLADRDYSKYSTAGRPSTIIDEVPMSHRDVFLQTFAEQKKQGKGDKEAAKAAASLIAAAPQGPTQLAQLNQKAPTPPPASVKANPAPPPTDPVQYQAWATQKAQEQGNQLSQGIIGLNDWMHDKIFQPIQNGIDWVDNTENEMNRGLRNLPNKLSVMFGGQPSKPWTMPFPKIQNKVGPFYDPISNRNLDPTIDPPIPVTPPTFPKSNPWPGAGFGF